MSKRSPVGSPSDWVPVAPAGEQNTSDPLKHPLESEQDESHNDEAKLEVEAAEFSFSCRFPHFTQRLHVPCNFIQPRSPKTCSFVRIRAPHLNKDQTNKQIVTHNTGRLVLAAHSGVVEIDLQRIGPACPSFLMRRADGICCSSSICMLHKSMYSQPSAAPPQESRRNMERYHYPQYYNMIKHELLPRGAKQVVYDLFKLIWGLKRFE